MNKIVVVAVSVLFSINLLSQNTNIPDDNFEQALIDLGYDDVLDDYVLTSNISSVTSLDLRDEEITDLTGIGDFEALASLNIGNNKITSIDLSSNVNLVSLLCYNNLLESLDLSGNVNLEVVNCSENSLTAISLTNNTQLREFYCALNNLSGLDLSSNSKIEKLWCYESNLTELNIKNGANNLLAGTFTVGDYTYARFRALDNPNLTCIYVDNAGDANNQTGNYAGWEFDATSTFVETVEECNTLSFEDNFTNVNIKIYPNPTSGILNIENLEGNQVKKISLFNDIGKSLFSIPSSLVKFLDITSLESGVYYLKLEKTKGKIMTFKVIKE